MPIQLTVVSLDRDAEELPRVSVFSQDEITLGRDLTNDIILDSPAVAAHHARIRVEEDGHNPALYITDLGSDTGIIVEDEKITPMVEVALPLNKRFTIGSFLIKPSAQRDQEKKRRRRAVLNPAALAQDADANGSESVAEVGAAPLVESAGGGMQIASGHTPGRDTTEAIIQLTNLLSDYQPAEEAAQAQAAVGELIAAVERSSLTSANGTQEDSATVEASHESIVEILIDGTDVNNLDFEAVELFTVGGQVLHNGQPLAGVRVNAGVLGESVTGEDGRFRYADVPDGTECVVSVEHESFMFNRPESQVKVDAADVEIAIAATKLLTISGRVMHKGKPMEGVEIDGGPLGITHTDENGVYTFKNVPDGSQYTLTARKGNFQFGTVSAKPQ